MIKLETKYDYKEDKCKVTYKSDKSCTLEHIYAIRRLVESILENDKEMDWPTIRSIINNTLVENDKIKKEKEKKNGKRNSETTTEI